jgi:hypothetical protein
VQDWRKVCKIESKDQDRLNKLIEELTKAIKGLGDYVPALDDPYIITIAKSIIYAEKIEAWIDESDDIDVVTSATYIIANHRAMMNDAIANLAASRKERLKRKNETEVKDEIEKFVRELMGFEKGK